MKKHKLVKLSLDRETLAPLQPDALDAVHGGLSIADIWRSVQKVSQLVCPSLNTIRAGGGN